MTEKEAIGLVEYLGVLKETAVAKELPSGDWYVVIIKNFLLSPDIRDAMKQAKKIIKMTL